MLIFSGNILDLIIAYRKGEKRSILIKGNEEKEMDDPTISFIIITNFPNVSNNLQDWEDKPQNTIGYF